MDSRYAKIKNAREDSSLSLRKEAFYKSLIKSRFSSLQTMNINDKAFEIDNTVLNINKELLDAFEKAGINDKVTIAYSQMNSDQMNYVMYGMKQIRNFTETLTAIDSKSNKANANHDYSNSLITFEIFEVIYHYLTSKTNLNLIYEACCAMINITRYIPYYCSKLSEEKYLLGLVDILLHQQPSSIIIKSQVLIIIGNILELQGEVFIPKLLQAISFFDYITNLFQVVTSQDSDLPMYAIAVLLWNMGSFIKHSSQSDIETIAPVIIVKVCPLLIKLISNDINRDIFTEGIICFNWIIDRMKEFPQVICLFNESNVYSHLNSFIASNYKSNAKIIKMILIIYVNLTLVSDDAIKLLTEDSSIYSTIEKILISFIDTLNVSQTKNDIVIFTYQLLNNCASMGQECNEIIRKTKIVEYTMTILNLHKSNRKLINEIVVFLSNAIDSNDSRIKMELMRYPLIEFAVSELTFLECPITDIKANCLKIINLYLTYGDTLIKNKNIFKEQLELLNLPDVLSNLHNKSNNDSKRNIEDTIETIYNRYFKNGS